MPRLLRIEDRLINSDVHAEVAHESKCVSVLMMTMENALKMINSGVISFLSVNWIAVGEATLVLSQSSTAKFEYSIYEK